MATTTRAIRDDVKNILDYMQDAELALTTNEVSMHSARVSWHSRNPSIPFMNTRGHATVRQYLGWLSAGAYSAHRSLLIEDLGTHQEIDPIWECPPWPQRSVPVKNRDPNRLATVLPINLPTHL